jgi:hypothetical protein
MFRSLLIFVLIISVMIVNNLVRYQDVNSGGYNPLSTSVVILGTCRNIAQWIPKTFDNVYRVAGLFNSYKIVIYENDSQDTTLTDLQKINDTNLHIITEKNVDIRYPYRTWRLAYGRNMVLNYARDHYSNYDYIIVMDLDDVAQSVYNINHIRQMLDQNNLWDSISFNLPYYYDRWALRYPGADYNLWGYSDVKKRDHDIQVDITRILQSRGDKLFPVYSAFQGFAIYKFNIIGNCAYDGHNRDTAVSFVEDCEHVPFHKCIGEMQNGRIMITPLMIVQ